LIPERRPEIIPLFFDFKNSACSEIRATIFSWWSGLRPGINLFAGNF